MNNFEELTTGLMKFATKIFFKTSFYFQFNITFYSNLIKESFLLV